MQPRFLSCTDPCASWRELLAHAAARALALFFGGFSLLNLLGGLRLPGFDANLWWIDLRAFPKSLDGIVLLLASLCLISFAIRPPHSRWRCDLTTAVAGVLAMAALWNIVEFYYLLAHGSLRPLLPVPLSLFVLAALTLIIRVNLRPALPTPSSKPSLGMLAVFCFCLVSFPLAQMICFGKTDYRRPADVAVVFGARAYADGRPSDALADRVSTACQLYRDGLVKKLIFSGGPGDGAVHETEAMRRQALRLGVRPADILVDTAGLNTQATVKNTEAMFSQLGAHHILVVSHFYHLPRIKMAYQRAGWDVYTVPAKETYFLRQTPFFMAREVAAMWAYYFRPLVSSTAG
ncbi:MAG TPA: YdcF family protein [Verrucomicrobiae bacterium]|nr:YdcF family protein [Verrucomicrobiae bacterium]